MKTSIFFSYLFLSCTLICFSQQNNQIIKKIYTTKSISQEITIDGLLDDDAWNAVDWGTNFTENDPDENTAPTYQTKFKIVYDAKYLYIAVKALDEVPEDITKRLSRRDGFAGDRVNIVIDSYHDKRTAFVFYNYRRRCKRR